MGFLKNLFKDITGPSFRPTLEAHPALTAVVGPMKSSNIAPALALYNASPQDPELRYRLVEAAANLFGAEDTRAVLLDAWVKNAPQDAYATLVRAAWRVASAPNWRPDDPEDVADRARAANSAAAQFVELEKVGDAFDEADPWNLSKASYANIRTGLGLS